MLTIQFGQCGNQLGQSLFSHLSADLDAKDTFVSKQDNSNYTEKSFEKWFTGTNKDGKRLPRALLIDTERKVIRQICNNEKDKWAYNPQNLICQPGGGSANNWAYGSLIKGPELKDDILEKTRKEIEMTDAFDGVLLLLSSAGGTGSGVGSYVADMLRNEFPSKTIIGSIILPFESGEVVVQNYNSMLTLAKFNEMTDLTLLFQNEHIYSICTKVLNNTKAKLMDINDVMSRKLCATLQPVNDTWCNTNYLSSIVACHPSYKFASIEGTPYVSSEVEQFESIKSWGLYAKNLKRTLRRPILADDENAKSSASLKSTETYYYKSVSNVLFTRGKIADNDPLICDDLRNKSLYVDWLDTSERLNCLNQPRRLLGQEKFLSLVSNNGKITPTIDRIVDKAWTCYINAAYLHQYKKFGLQEDDFLEAFAKAEHVIANYKKL